jgi:hypothetical protein
MRFTIRDVLWLMVVVAVCCAWWIDHAKSQKERALLMQSHANLQELRQMLGSDKGLNELIALAKAHNLAAAPPNTVVINLPNKPKPTTPPPAPKAIKSN